MYNKFKNILFISIITFSLYSCSHYNVKVSALSRNTIPTKIFVAPGNKNINISDLQFTEYARYIKIALSKQGYTVVNDINTADQVVLLAYGISDPKEIVDSIPQYRSVQKSNVYTSKNSNMTVIPLNTYEFNGYSNRVSVVYYRFITLTAFDWKLFSKTKEEQQIWQTQILSEGSGNDLREIFPYLVLASEPYLGKNTKKEIEVKIRPLITDLKDYQ